jgi:hypothetical protein
MVWNDKGYFSQEAITWPLDFQRRQLVSSSGEEEDGAGTWVAAGVEMGVTEVASSL